MMVKSENKNGLKGQYNLAQGNPEASGRPGLENGQENRPRDKVHQREDLISDQVNSLVFSGNNDLQFRPKKNICFEFGYLADG
jgi:hypothetical protein